MRIRSVSYSQQRLFVVEQLAGEGGIYKLAGVMRLEGELDVEVLERTFQEVVRRHEVMRTVFEERSEGLVQLIKQEEEVRIGLVELSGLETERRERVVAELARS